MITTTDDPREQLDDLNRRLSRLLGKPPNDLASCAGIGEQDRLIVCGILGCKDVGKSTLINALAGAKISKDHELVGEGTSGPVAYVHKDDRREFDLRFNDHETNPAIPYQPFEHAEDAIRGLVLVDLPDIDSSFPSHLEIARTAIHRMERVIWMFDPKKADDQAVAELTRRVVHGHSNKYCVMAKFDLLLKDGLDGMDAEAFWKKQKQWFTGDVIGVVGVDVQEGQTYMVSAGYGTPTSFIKFIKDQWGDDPPMTGPEQVQVSALAELAAKELENLRQELRKPLSGADVQRIKADHRNAQVQANAQRLLDYFEVEKNIRHCDGIHKLLKTEFAANFDENYFNTIGRRLARTIRPPTELAHDLMSQSIVKWPELGAVYWPLSSIFRFISRRMIPTSAAAMFTGSDLHRVQGLDLYDRAKAMTSAIKPRLPEGPKPLVDEISVHDPTPLMKRIAAELVEKPAKLEDEIIAFLSAPPKPAGRLSRGAIWFVLFWFLLVQPILAGVLELAATRNLTDALRATAAIVSALGAGAFLKGLGAVVAIYLGILAIVYVRAVRDVCKQIEDKNSAEEWRGPFETDVFDLLQNEILRPMLDQTDKVREELQACQAKLNKLLQFSGKTIRCPGPR
ncbi:MAG: 50S ribosome-binding GTPase [Planctomycetes bacterium]|nr:50S ribosome-binding GTPase [Planctomycetota bacterium]